MEIQPSRFATRSLHESPRGDDICQVLAAAINSADAGEAVRQAVSLNEDQLTIAGKTFNLGEFERIFVIAAGKATAPMVMTLQGILGPRMTASFGITKEGYLDPSHTQADPRITIVEARHPIPEQSNLDASARLMELVGNITRRDMVICLLSGGGSALLTRPSAGLSLDELQITTQLLLTCGSSIGEINAIRKHLDELKGGGLARLLYPATVVSLIISDVVGDHLDQVASGPTAADPTTFQYAWAILEKYELTGRIPTAILDHLQAGIAGKVRETVKPGNSALERVTNCIVASNALAVATAARTAKELGYHTQVLSSALQGEASKVGRSLTETIKLQVASLPRAWLPACFIAGGETTVTIHGTGLGGRNQELALGAVDSLAGDEQRVLVSLATDGGDGPTDAAGAVATNQTRAFGFSLGLDPQAFLANNDAYHYFAPLGDLLITGPTLTNVNDLVFVFAG